MEFIEKNRNNFKKPFFIISISKRRHHLNFNLNNHNEKGLITKKYQNSYRDIRLSYSENTKYFFHKESNIILILYGELYDVNKGELEYLHSNYLKNGINFIRSINGSYALFIMDLTQDKFFIVIDRINSRKIFQYVDSDCFIFSNSIYFFNDFSLSADPKAIAWYLSNGAVFNSRTLFKEIKVLKRATITEISKNHIKQKTYWVYGFNNEYKNISEKELSSELHKLLIRSVEKRIKSNDEIYISLSGGYDSAAILGIIRYSLKLDDVKTFTYAHGNISCKSDAYVSKLMAEKCGYKFNILPAFVNNLLSFLEENAYWGQGTANICDEINAINTIRDELGDSPNNNLFFGDECFGWVDEPITSKREAFRSLRIYDFDNLRLLDKFLPSHLFSNLKDELIADYADVLNLTPDFEDHFDTKNYLYLDQRISNVMTSWRDFFYSTYARIQNPFLDNDILDFMQKLPKNHRIDKLLFKNTVEKFYPEIFKFKRAKTSNAVPIGVYSALFRQNVSLLNDWLKEANIFDQYVPTDSIKELMRYEENLLDTYLHNARFIIRKASRRSKHIKKTFNVLGCNSESVDKTTLLKRVFTLRKHFKLSEANFIDCAKMSL